MELKQPTYMQCDKETGVCELPDTTGSNKTTLRPEKPVRLLYFTDPICSTCWGVEPQVRKLVAEYGNYFDIEYRMGGLLKSWEEYGGKDVASPADVASHWDEASLHYDMPIDGDLWKEDPLTSSYPPSIAFKATQLQGEEKAEKFLRRIREMVLMEKKNITRTEHLESAVLDAGLDVERFRLDVKERAPQLFNEDLAEARQWGVRGFPTMFFIDSDDNRFKVYGNKPYESYEQALLKLVPHAVKEAPAVSYETVFDRYETLTTKEFAALNNKNTKEAAVILGYLEAQGVVQKQTSKNGPLWKKV